MTEKSLNVDNFIDQIHKNLNANGFPAKKVSFPLEKMYELADNKGLNFNQVREQLKEVGILTTCQDDKVVFYQEQQQDNIKDQLKQAQEMFEQMSDDEKKNIYEQFQKMSTTEKQDIFN